MGLILGETVMTNRITLDEAFSLAFEYENSIADRALSCDYYSDAYDYFINAGWSYDDFDDWLDIVRVRSNARIDSVLSDAYMNAYNESSTRNHEQTREGDG